MTGRREFLKGTAAIAVVGTTANAAAQAWPARAIKVTVPWPAGGNADVTIRPILDRMAQHLGQSIVVENRAGATGMTGSIAASRAVPDGYNLLQLSSSTVINNVLLAEKPLDIGRDFAPIGLGASTPLVLEVHPSMPANTVAEFIAYARANPGKLSYASGGIGTSAHLLSELLKQKAGIDLLHVPYQGGAPAVADLIGGHVNMYFDVLPTALPAAKGGRVRILAISAAKRSAALPDIEAAVWVAMLAPKGTDAAIVTRLNEAMNIALGDPGVRQRLATIGADPTPGTPDKLAALIRSETDKWGEVVRRAGIKAQ
jgi:tripartite-type tricarboxylate transporter receptor subunit TctC